MLQFLSPIFLVGLTALAIPLVIHLWSRRSGKTIKVGTIRFLRASDSHRFSSVKLQDSLLLFVRAVLIVLLVLLLARPILLSQAPSGKNSEVGWILLDPELINRGIDGPISQQIDSLSAHGNELRVLGPSFPRVSLDDSVRTEDRKSVV